MILDSAGEGGFKIGSKIVTLNQNFLEVIRRLTKSRRRGFGAGADLLQTYIDSEGVLIALVRVCQRNL